VLVRLYFYFFFFLIIDILAAVSALAKFGAASEELLPNILVLLQRTTLDQDDEVRDRATFYYQLLKQNDKALNSAYILNCKYTNLLE
jgi:hypothetical protein